jgi:hypothetical protein
MSFELFYSAYPRKQKKLDAMKAWEQMQKSKKVKFPEISVILDAIKWQSKTDQWVRGFIPLPASWLRSAQWDDQPMVKPRTDKPEPKPPTIYKDGVPLATKEQKSNIFADLKKKFMGGV